MGIKVRHGAARTATELTAAEAWGGRGVRGIGCANGRYALETGEAGNAIGPLGLERRTRGVMAMVRGMRRV